MLREAYPLFAKICRERGIVPIYTYTPVIQDTLTQRDPEKDARLMALARESGFVVMAVSDAFHGQDTNSLRVTAWDWHPNVRGHRLIAERLYQAFRQSEQRLGLKLAQRGE